MTTPLCCADGWKLAFCNSRHLTPAEQNYAPIEGGALAVCWALKKARIFLLGCRNFDVIVDYQPLVKILGDKSLSTIVNHRLFAFKERTLPYSFKIEYIKGINNHANTFSRYPSGTPDSEDVSSSIILQTAGIHTGVFRVNNVLMITIDKIKEIAAKDVQYQELIEKVQNGTFADSSTLESSNIKEFYNVRNNLSIVGDVVMYGFESHNLRIVIPKPLRHQAIINLHAAHQGTTSMLNRAREQIYVLAWNGARRKYSYYEM